MIIGIGTDIVYVPRISTLWEKYGNKFLNKVFNIQEILDSDRYSKYRMKVYHFAKRFAAKEAYVKALGTGFRGIKMKDIIVHNDYNGKPGIVVNSSMSYTFKNHKTYLSISDDSNYVVAFVILENVDG